MQEVNTNKRKDTLPLVLAIIGIVADIIGITTFIINANNSPGQNTQLSDLSLIVGEIIMVYSWFVLSWYFVQRHFNSLSEKKASLPVITNTTIGVGLLLLPISILIAMVKNEPGFGFLHLLIWALVYIGIRLLLPVIYPDVVKRLTSLSFDTVYGRYICQAPYESSVTKEKFKKGDFIQIYSKEVESPYYWYRSLNDGGGKIHYSEIETFWIKYVISQQRQKK